MRWSDFWGLCWDKGNCLTSHSGLLVPYPGLWLLCQCFPKPGFQATYLRIMEGNADSWAPPRHTESLGGGAGGVWIFFEHLRSLLDTPQFGNYSPVPKMKCRLRSWVLSIPKDVACWFWVSSPGRTGEAAAWLVLLAHHEEKNCSDYSWSFLRVQQHCLLQTVRLTLDISAVTHWPEFLISLNLLLGPQSAVKPLCV